MESLNPKLTLYGSKNQCAMTDAVFLPLYEVSTRKVTLEKKKMFFLLIFNSVTFILEMPFKYFTSQTKSVWKNIIGSYCQMVGNILRLIDNLSFITTYSQISIFKKYKKEEANYQLRVFLTTKSSDKKRQ